MPRVNKTREELIKEMQNSQDFKEKMAFTREKFYPALVTATSSIEDATTFLGSINSVVMESFLGFMKEKKLKDLNLVAKLDPTDPKYEQIKALIMLFDDKSVFDAKDLLEGMRNEISLWVNEDLRSRGLDTLPKRWIDEL